MSSNAANNSNAPAVEEIRGPMPNESNLREETLSLEGQVDVPMTDTPLSTNVSLVPQEVGSTTKSVQSTQQEMETCNMQAHADSRMRLRWSRQGKET